MLDNPFIPFANGTPSSSYVIDDLLM